MLQGISPPIWRRLQVPADIGLEDLHDVILVAMGWEKAHLHQFIVNATAYGMSDAGFADNIENEREVQLEHIAKEGDRFIYGYDSGDGWGHEIEIDKTFLVEPDTLYPRWFAGKRPCPTTSICWLFLPIPAMRTTKARSTGLAAVPIPRPFISILSTPTWHACGRSGSR